MTAMNARDGWYRDDGLKDRMIPGNATRSLPIMLMLARDAVMSHFKPLLNANGISEPQWRVMRVLADCERMEAHEVAARASVLPPSLTRMTQALAARGIVARTPCTTDRRKLFLSMTPAGIELMTMLVAASTASYLDLIERFGRDRFDLLFELLADMARLGAGEKA